MSKKKVILLLVGLMTIFFAGVLIAQETGGELPIGIDWTKFGVSTGVIAVIITIVQFTKQWIPAKVVVFVPMVLAAIAFFIVGGDQPKENVFYWAAAAGYLWKMANVITPANILKSKQ